MHIFFGIMFIIMMLFAAVNINTASTVLQEIVGFMQFIIGVLFLVGAGIIEAIGKTKSNEH